MSEPIILPVKNDLVDGGHVIIDADTARRIEALARDYREEQQFPPEARISRREEQRPCPKCGELVLWAISPTLGAHPIQYHDCDKRTDAGPTPPAPAPVAQGDEAQALALGEALSRPPQVNEPLRKAMQDNRDLFAQGEEAVETGSDRTRRLARQCGMEHSQSVVAALNQMWNEVQQKGDKQIANLRQKFARTCGEYDDKIAAQAKRIADYEANNIAAGHEIDGLTKRIAELEAELDTTRAEIAAMRTIGRESLSGLNDEIDKLRAQNELLVTLTGDYESDRSKACMERDEARARVAELERESATNKAIAEEALRTKDDAEAHWKNAYDEVSAELVAEKLNVADATQKLEACRAMVTEESQRGIAALQTVDKLNRRVRELERALHEETQSHAGTCVELGVICGALGLDIADNSKAVDSIKSMRADAERLTSERDALQRFKDFVHTRLTQMGVMEHPNGKHSAAGCRIGDRLDIIEAERTELAALKARKVRLPNPSVGAGSDSFRDGMRVYSKLCADAIRAAGIEVADE